MGSSSDILYHLHAFQLPEICVIVLAYVNKRYAVDRRHQYDPSVFCVA